MRRKRLHHAAHVLCHMFCGWRLINSYADLERLESGILTIDVLTEACTFNSLPIPPPAIAAELVAWWRADCAAHAIDTTYIQQALLTAQLDIEIFERRFRRRKTASAQANQSRFGTAVWISCKIACVSRIVTDETVYLATYTDHEGWPRGWPGQMY